MTSNEENAPDPGRDRPRTRRDYAQDRLDLRERTRREIVTLAAEFHARQLPERAGTIGVIYARYSTRFQASILDQVRACFEEAARLGIHVPAENVCFDLATRGGKKNREGLVRVQALIESKEAKVLLAFTTNRLHRKVYRCLQFIEEEVVERGLRAIFVKSKIDTADAHRWKMLLNFHATMDEFVVSMYADNVRAAHEGLFDRRVLFGAVPYGYGGEPIPGEFTKAKKPRCLVVITPETGRWVLQIYRWYVEDRVPLEEIARRLNGNPEVPPPERRFGGAWTRGGIRSLLRNERYRGFWEYGKTKVVWLSKKDYARQVKREVPLRAEQVEEWRLVPDALWYAAQVLLAEQARLAGGRWPSVADRRSIPRMLNGLFYCPEHDRPLIVLGGGGQYLSCPACHVRPVAERALFTQLSRAIALRRTCEALAALLIGDEELVAAVIAACRSEAERAQRPDPSELEGMRRRRRQLDGQIEFGLRNVGESEADQQETAKVLREKRRERDELRWAISRREEAEGRPPVVPTEAEVRALLGELGSVLTRAADEGTPEEVVLARALVDLLTGGRIDLEQCGERTRFEGWLRGLARVRLLPHLVERAGGGPSSSGEETFELTIDYRDSTRAEDLADDAKALEDQGLLQREIAEGLGVSSQLAGQALSAWYARHGQERGDGRGRRATLVRKRAEPPGYARMSEDAKLLWDQGLPRNQIAKRLKCHFITASNALIYWFRSRGLAVPDLSGPRPGAPDGGDCGRPGPPAA